MKRTSKILIKLQRLKNSLGQNTDERITSRTHNPIHKELRIPIFSRNIWVYNINPTWTYE